MIDLSITGLMSKVMKSDSNLSFLNSYFSKKYVILEDIPLELVYNFDEDLPSDVPTLPLDNGSNINDNISNSSGTFSIKVQIIGDNYMETYDKILNLRNRRKEVKLYVDKLYSNLAIKNITRTNNSLTSIELNISFVQINTVNLQLIPAPSKLAKPITSNKTEVKTSKQEWEGDLASSGIKLPGEK